MTAFVFTVLSCQKEVNRIQSPDPLPDSVTTKLLPHLIRNDHGFDSLVYDDRNRLIEEWKQFDGAFAKTVFQYTGDDKVVSRDEYNIFPGPLTHKRTFSENSDGTVTSMSTSYSGGREYVFIQKHAFNERGQVVATFRESDGRKQQEFNWNEDGRLTSSGNFDFDTWISWGFSYDDKLGIYSAVASRFVYPELDNHLAKCFDVNNLLEATMSYTNNSGDVVTSYMHISYTYNEQGYPVTVKAREGDNEFTHTITYIEAK